MIVEIVPIVAGLASLLAGAAKYAQDWLRTRNSTSTKITIGNETVQLTGSLSKEDLATVIEALQAKAAHGSTAAAPDAAPKP